MQDSQSAAARDMSTAGFAGSDLRNIELRTGMGTHVSLRRFLQQWLVLWVTDGSHPPCHPPGYQRGAYRLSVVLAPGDGGPCEACRGDALYDHHGYLLAMFPGLVWPATFLLNPEGRLVAIVEGNDQGGLIRQFLCAVPGVSQNGAVDLGDISG